jgi:hypothetical protein
VSKKDCSGVLERGVVDVSIGGKRETVGWA